MDKKLLLAGSGIAVVMGTSVYVMKKMADRATYRIEILEEISLREIGFYEKYVKRVVDIICAIGAIIVFFPVYLVVCILVRLKLGSPVLYTQDRPGIIKDGKETIFKIYKFRSMTEERDESGELLQDERRLTAFGKWLRSTSLDELPEAFNILNGTMSVIGPRPQLVRDIVFMTPEQRMRHTAKPGLSGLAQVNGRNSIDWEEKLNWDLKYIEKVSFLSDLKIIFSTVEKAFIKREGITEGNMATAEDFGDYMLSKGKVDCVEYERLQAIAKEILR